MKFRIKTIGEDKKKKKHFFIIKLILWILVLFLTIFFSFSIYVLAQVRNVLDSRYHDVDIVSSALVDSNECGVFGCMTDVVFNKSCSIKESRGITNILLLGAGGKDHIQGGPVLTDTIIFVSINHEKDDISMVSIPRDLWIEPKDHSPAKINTLYRTSTSLYDEGFTIPKLAVEDLLDMPIHYYAYIDFIAFKEIIDALGGIDIYVDNDFVDYKYPDGNFGYMTVKFDVGASEMNGEKALQFARSRHGTNGESSDFARAKRQQKIIQAIKDKILSFGTIFRIDGIAKAIQNNYRSNIKPCEIYQFLILAKDIPKEKIYSTVLDDGPSGLLYTPTIEMREEKYGGQYVLLPDGNNYDMIKKYVSKFLSNPNAFTTGPTISVLNGTATAGLANVVGAELASEGYRVILRDNTYNRTHYKSTVVYSERPGDFYKSLLYLEGYSGGKATSLNPEPLKYQSDIVLILGEDFKGLEGEN